MYEYPDVEVHIEHVRSTRGTRRYFPTVISAYCEVHGRLSFAMAYEALPQVADYRAQSRHSVTSTSAQARLMTGLHHLLQPYSILGKDPSNLSRRCNDLRLCHQGRIAYRQSWILRCNFDQRRYRNEPDVYCLP